MSETTEAIVPARPPRRPRFGLSWKVLGLAAIFVVVSLVLIYVPSIANFRSSWIGDRLASAAAAGVILTAPDQVDVPLEIQARLLETVRADAIIIREGNVSRLISAARTPPRAEVTTDTRDPALWTRIGEAFDTLLYGGGRVLRVIGETQSGGQLELVMHDDELRAAMVTASFNTVWLAAGLSVAAGAVLFFVINRLLVRPVRRMSRNMVSFREAPEDASRIIHPTGRRDEIGIAEGELATMQTDLRATLQQQRRLADLGLGVSKIIHDLRNMLSSAQLFSDRISALPDPSVQRFAPKLIAALDRAIGYAQSTLTYGRPQEDAPRRRLLRLAAVVTEVAETLSLDTHPTVRWENKVPPSLEVDADPDQLFRVLMNLTRNAVQAMEGDEPPAVVRRLTIEAERTGAVATLRVRDTGPGVPEKARAFLFQPFQGSSKVGGTGLGLAISAELIRAHGGSIELKAQAGPGTTFEITIPDRPLDFLTAGKARAS
ncbi:MAG: HAMP domain-containing histidine kinase [Bauldia sp.]|nr:HAMP domain-containing histidine kinase [Bauldia sp.]